MRVRTAGDGPRRGADPNDGARAVEGFLDGLVEAWNRHDMDAFAAAFAPDADFVNVVGFQLGGRTAIEAQHRELHRTIMRNTRITSWQVAVRFLGPGVALAHARWEMTGVERLPGWDVPDIRRGVMTVVLTRGDERWWVAALHNTDTLPVPMPGSPAGG